MRVFFSYSHDNEEHKAWVSNIAKDLSSRGFETILDQNDLMPGKDILRFAESAVRSADFVLMVCTPEYARKANDRSHGVGWEASMITAELFSGAEGKFISLLRSGTAETSIPCFMKTKLYIDVRNDNDKSQWERLCNHMKKNGDALQIGNLIYEALFDYNEERIYDQPRLRELKRFTEFVKTDKDKNGIRFVIRKDPIKGDLTTIIFRH